MNWGIKLPTGEFMDTPPDFNIAFELNNQVFTSGDTSVLPGSYSFPAELILTPNVKRQLGNPQRVDNARYFQPIEGVWACIGTNPIFKGILKIIKVSGEKISLSLIVNPLANFKNTNLDQLDLGGARTISPHSFWSALMIDTANNPEDYDFAFFPVLGAEINNWPDYFNNGIPWFHQNFFEVGGPGFDTVDSGIISPFVKLEYLLQQIFSNLSEDYVFYNAWQGGSLELKRLYVYNNADVRDFEEGDTEPGLPTEFNLTKHVPKIKVTEFIKAISAQWCLGMFANPFKRTFRLVPLNTVLSAGTNLNWTAFVSSKMSIESPEEFPKNFNYIGSTSPRAGIPPPHKAEHFDTYEDYQAGTPTNRYVHIEAHTLLLDRFTPGGIFGLDSNRWKLHAGYFTDPDSTEFFDPGIEGLFGTDAFSMIQYESSVELPRWSDITTPGGSTEWSLSQSGFPLALMLFRGVQSTPDPETGDAYPLACNHVWAERAGAGQRVKIMTAGDIIQDAEYSLNWEGEYGLYNRQWKLWHSMLQVGKHVSVQFLLPWRELLEFSFEEKIRVENMDYFVKRLRVQKLLPDGRLLCEASMVSVI
jgi:hypothetical protein